jgi:hypothetical protein
MEKKYTVEDMSYIDFVARKYCYLCEPGWEEYVVENARDLFQRRTDLIDCASNYDLYKSTETMQAKVEKYDLDAEKFWLLLLFLKDYTDSCFGKSLVFDEVSVGKNVKDMIDMLDNSSKEACEITISTKNTSAHINAIFVRNELKELLLNLQQNELVDIDNSYPCIKTDEDNVQWHKIKFFMGMLDYFLTNYHSNMPPKPNSRKDWLLFAQSLYLVGYLSEEKYLNGYTVTIRKKVRLDKSDLIYEERTPLRGLGKFFTDNTKHLSETANRRKSQYCYNNFFDITD